MQTLVPMIRIAAEHGLSAADALAGTGIDPDAIADPHAMLTRTQELRVCRNIVNGTDRPDIGLLAGYASRPNVIGPLGYAEAACATVDELLTVARSYRQLGLSLMRWDVFNDGEELVHRFTDKDELGDVRVFVVEHLLAEFLRITRELVLDEAAPTRVRLGYPDPGYAQAYRDLFGPKVEFNQPVTELRFPVTYRDIPLRSPDPLVRSRMEQLCQALVSKLNSHLILADEVKSMLQADEPETPSVGAIARRLHVSARSLHRHLAKQNTTYRALVDEVHRERAIRYLTNTDIPIPEIASRCGFVELSSFYSAFRRWTGMSPANYRKGHFNH